MKLHSRSRDKYKLHFGKKHCNYQCPSIIVAMKKWQNKSQLSTYIYCLYFSDKHDDDDILLQHLSSLIIHLVMHNVCLGQTQPENDSFNGTKHLSDTGTRYDG